MEPTTISNEIHTECLQRQACRGLVSFRNIREVMKVLRDDYHCSLLNAVTFTPQNAQLGNKLILMEMKLVTSFNVASYHGL